MTDREERQHVIEVLQKMVDWMESINYIVATPEKRRALEYAIASIKTDLKYDLLYEGVDCNNCKNNWHRGDGSTYCATGDGMCHYECEEPTTKNDLSSGLKNVSPIIDWNNCHTSEQLNSIATTKNDLGVDCISREQAKEAIRDKFKDLPSRVEINTILNELPSVTPQEPILDRVRAELESKLDNINRLYNQDNQYDDGAIDSLQYALDIIDKYRAETER